MDPGFLLVENFARFAAAVGLLVAAPLFVWGGYLWMTSMGDPNRSAAARNAVVSVGIGIIIIGSSFILPRVIGEFVVAPSGGIVFERQPGVNCDGMLREQLMINRTASTPSRMNFLIQRIQSRFEDCNAALWGRRSGRTALTPVLAIVVMTIAPTSPLPESRFRRVWSGASIPPRVVMPGTISWSISGPPSILPMARSAGCTSAPWKVGWRGISADISSVPKRKSMT